MLDARTIRTILILALSLPCLTLLASWGDSADRVAQMHPAILALLQVLSTLTAMMTANLASDAT